MKWYWIKTGWLIKKLFPRFIWEKPTVHKTVYLTFDDGPIPEITEWVLEVLSQHDDVKATFFCIGDNIEKHPDIFKKVVDAGHTIGNHTFNHLNGWNTGHKTYIQNVLDCKVSIEQKTKQTAKLFRPPYGKIRSAQARKILSMGYQIVMWDILSADFDKSITPQACYNNVIKNAANGSIIIFHDSVKAFSNMKYALPRVIEKLKEDGYSFDTLN